MMVTYLPKALELSDGVEYPIRWGFRAALDLFEALNDPDATAQERAYYVLSILYEDWESIPEELLQEAIEKGAWYLSGGEERSEQEAPRLMDWEQDLPIIIPAVNRVAGVEVRELPSLHWWTFLGYYQEIGGECTFAQVVSIRDKLRKRKPLSKEERDYYNRNKKMIDLQSKKTGDEEDFLSKLVAKRKG